MLKFDSQKKKYYLYKVCEQDQMRWHVPSLRVVEWFVHSKKMNKCIIEVEM